MGRRAKVHQWLILFVLLCIPQSREDRMIDVSRDYVKKEVLKAEVFENLKAKGYIRKNVEYNAEKSSYNVCVFCEKKIEDTKNICCEKYREATKDKLKTERRLEEIKKKQRQSGMTKRQRRNNFKNFIVNEKNKKIVQKIKKFPKDKEAIQNGRGLVFFGRCGTGKSHLASAVVTNILAIYPEIKVCCTSFAEILYEIKRDFSKFEAKRFIEHDVYFIDDVGQEKVGEWAKEIMYLLVNKRYEDDKTMIFTTNLTVDEFKEKFGEAVVSRLSEVCDFIHMKGINDYRKGEKC